MGLAYFNKNEMVKFPGVLKRIKEFGQEVLGKAVDIGRNILNNKIVDTIANKVIDIGGKAIPFGEPLLKIGYNKTKDNFNRLLDAGANIANNPNLGLKDVLKEYGNAVKDNLVNVSPIGTFQKVREGGLNALLEELGL